MLRLLQADSACKLKLVTTGAKVLAPYPYPHPLPVPATPTQGAPYPYPLPLPKVLERLDSFRGGGISFKLAQEGLHLLVPHMRKQVVFASTADFERLLEHRPGGTPVDDLVSERARDGARACRSGWVAVVHDPEARGMLVPGAPLPLMLAALRCNRPAAAVELQLKKAEVQSVRYRLDMASGKDMASA